MSYDHDVLVRRILSCLDSHPAASAEVIARQLGVHRHTETRCTAGNASRGIPVCSCCEEPTARSALSTS